MPEPVPLYNDIQLPPEEGTVPLPNGCTLYWKLQKEVGCREYYSDEIGGGVVVWNTALVDVSTLLAAIVEEERMSKQERVFMDRQKKP